MLKELALSDTSMKWSANGSIEQIQAFHALLDDKSVQRRGDLHGSWVFASMDRVAHQRGNWAFGIAMDSTRICRRPFRSLLISHIRALWGRASTAITCPAGPT